MSGPAEGLSEEEAVGFERQIGLAFWRQEPIMPIIERIASAAASRATERAAKIADIPTGHYEVGTKRLPYWDGSAIAALIRGSAVDVTCPDGSHIGPCAIRGSGESGGGAK